MNIDLRSAKPGDIFEVRWSMTQDDPVIHVVLYTIATGFISQDVTALAVDAIDVQYSWNYSDRDLLLAHLKFI